MNESTKQKPGQSDQKIQPEKVVSPGHSPQSQAKPHSKVVPSPSTPPLKADAGLKTAQK